jgi:hypothetical protein
MNRLVATDPLQLGVVSFVYGIPPNTLEGIGEMFAQYVNHVGDQDRNRAHDRYPMHVFRDAAETFDEPHSPLEFQTNDAMLRSVVDVARHVWGDDGGIHLYIREWNEGALVHDMNRVIELLEALLQHFSRRPEVADRIFENGAFPDLARLYNSRRYRVSNTWTPPEGNGDRH